MWVKAGKPPQRGRSLTDVANCIQSRSGRVKEFGPVELLKSVLAESDEIECALRQRYVLAPNEQTPVSLKDFTHLGEVVLANR